MEELYYKQIGIYSFDPHEKPRWDEEWGLEDDRFL